MRCRGKAVYTFNLEYDKKDDDKNDYVHIKTYYIRPPSIINYLINLFEIYQSIIPIKM